jgi:hypothetical protein
MMIPGGAVKILGLYYAMTADGITIAVPRRKRLETIGKIMELIENVKKKDIRLKDVQKALGNAAYVTCAQRTRAGSLIMRRLYPWAVQEKYDRMKRDRGERRRLAVSLRMLITLVSYSDPITITRASTNALQTYIFTDASGAGGPGGCPVIGALMLDVHGNAFAYSLPLPHMAGEEIDTLEAIAMLVALRVFKTKVMGTHIYLASCLRDDDAIPTTGVP